jgi:hypothetical protein
MPLGEVRFTVEDVADRTWSLFRARLSTCLGIFWGAFAVNWICQLAIAAVDAAFRTEVRDPDLGMASRFISFFASFVAAVFFTVGQNLALLKVARTEEVTFDEIFRGGRFVLTTILAWLLFGLILSVPGLGLYGLVIVFFRILLSNPSIGLLLLVFAAILVGIAIIVYLSARLGLYGWVIIDQNAGVLSCLAIAWLRSRRHVATIVLVYLLWLAINLAGLLLFCVGLIFTLPLSTLMLAVTYRALTGWGTVSGSAALDDWDHDTIQDQSQ